MGYRRTILVASISILAVAFFFNFIGIVEAKKPDMESLINEAVENNPQIQSAYSDWKAAEYKARYSGSLPDPMAKYTYLGKNVETRVGPQEHKYGVSQKFPFPGKLGKKVRAEQKHALMLEEKFEATKREVIKMVKFVFYDIFWVDQAIRVAEEEKSILESVESVAQRKYESNLASQGDVIKAQVEISKLIDRLFKLKQNRMSLVAKLGSILNRSESLNLDRVNNIEPQDFKLDLAKLNKIAGERSQELSAAQLDVQRAEYERSLAGLNYFPDFTLGFDYIQVGSGHTTAADDGEDAWMGSIAVNVPIWFGKLSAQSNEKKFALKAKEKSYENIENNIAFETEDLYLKINTYKDIVSLYKTALIPQTEQAFDATKIGYETGSVDFLNWLDSQRVLLQTKLAYYKAIVDYQKSIAYLERVVGSDL